MTAAAAARKKLFERYSTVGDPASFSSLNRLAKYSNKQVSRKDILNFLQSKDSFTLHRNRRRRYLHNFYKVMDMWRLVEIDLADFKSLQSFNDNYRYLLVFIDVFSKQLHVRPLKNKTGVLVADALEDILKTVKSKIKNIQSDSGKEFLAKPVQDVFTKNDIAYRRVTNPEQKASVVERVIRTLKIMIFKYLTEFNTNRFIDVLPKLVQAYNKRWHSTIKRAPIAVTPKTQQEVLQVYKQRWGKVKPVKPRFQLDDYVRIAKEQKAFDKGYTRNYTREIFKITFINKSLPLPMYALSDLNGTPISGHFLAAELSPVNFNLKTQLFSIEKILRRRGKGSKREAFVRWQGYPDSFNSWVKLSDIQKI